MADKSKRKPIALCTTGPSKNPTKKPKLRRLTEMIEVYEAYAVIQKYPQTLASSLREEDIKAWVSDNCVPSKYTTMVFNGAAVKLRSRPCVKLSDGDYYFVNVMPVRLTISPKLPREASYVHPDQSDRAEGTEPTISELPTDTSDQAGSEVHSEQQHGSSDCVSERDRSQGR